MTVAVGKFGQVGKGSIFGTFKVWFWTKKVEIYGGPYPLKPEELFGVCLLERKYGNPDIWYPIQDFSVPDDADALRHAIVDVMVAALKGKKVYVGCMGGQGRTGLMLALIAKAFGVPRPVEYVREVYYPHAVETRPQYQYVMKFDTSGIAKEALHKWVSGMFGGRLLSWIVDHAKVAD